MACTYATYMPRNAAPNYPRFGRLEANSLARSPGGKASAMLYGSKTLLKFRIGCLVPALFSLERYQRERGKASTVELALSALSATAEGDQHQHGTEPTSTATSGRTSAISGLTIRATIGADVFGKLCCAVVVVITALITDAICRAFGAAIEVG